MIWIAALLLASVTLAPIAWVLRGRSVARGRRDSAMALHRSQLVDLDRDLAEDRIGPAEHTTAMLEVQRRLLAAAEAPDSSNAGGSRIPLLATLIAVPVAAFALYAIGGSPGLPSEPLADRISAAQQREAEEASLIQQLRGRLAQLDPHSDQARQGYVLLGNVEEARGHFSAAVAAWRTALTSRFDATLAARTAEATTQADGRVSQDAADLFRRALNAAPKDAPWRALAEQRLAQAEAR